MLHENGDQEENAIPPMISRDEEKLGAYATKEEAIKIAKWATQGTGKWHKPVLTHTWRESKKKTCGTVILVK